MQKRAVTLADIAERIGTTTNTVSRALRDCTDIGPQMKERVKQTALEMGYVPNRIASFLRSKRSNIVAVAVSSLTNPFFNICMDYCIDYMDGKGYRPLISVVRNLMGLEDIISCLQNGACGILSFIDVSDEGVEYCEQNEVPLFICGIKPSNERVSAIYSDEYQCAKLVAQEAIAQSAKRPCYVNGVKSRLNEERRDNFIAILKASSLKCDVYTFDYYNKALSLEKIRRGLMENGNDFIFCFNDEIAAAVQELVDHVKDFHGDVYGVDRFSEYLFYCKKVKSVGGKIGSIGRRCAQLLIHKVEKYDGRIVREIFPVELNKQT